MKVGIILILLIAGCLCQRSGMGLRKAKQLAEIGDITSNLTAKEQTSIEQAISYAAVKCAYQINCNAQNTRDNIKTALGSYWQVAVWDPISPDDFETFFYILQNKYVIWGSYGILNLSYFITRVK